MANSWLRIKIAKSQLVRIDSLTIPVCHYQGVLIECSILSEDKDYTIIVTPKILCVAPYLCPLNLPITFKLTSGFKNPPFMMLVPLPVITEYVSSNDFSVLRGEILIKPDLQLGVLKNTMITQTGSLDTAMPTSFNFSFKFESKQSTGDRLFIKFPDQTLLPPLDNGKTPELACFDWATQKKFNCVVNERKDGYITTIAFENYCAIATCDQTVLQSFNITNINNVDFARPRSQLIKILVVLPENYVTSNGLFNETNLQNFTLQNITYFNVTRASTRPGTDNVELTFSFKNPIKIPNRSYITYIIPREQQILPQFTRIICSSTEKGGDQDLDCSTETRNKTHTILKVQEWCAGDCSVNSTISMKISKSMNPQSLDANSPSQSLGIIVENPSGYGIISNTLDIIISPPLDELKMLNVYIGRENYIIGADVNLTVSMQIPANVPNAIRMTIKFPYNTTFQPLDVNQSCLLKRDKKWESMNCLYNYYDSNPVFGLYPLTNVTIFDLCTSSAPCIEGQVYQVLIQVSNPRSNIVVGDPLNVTLIEPYKVVLSTDKIDLGQTKIQYNISDMEPGLIKAKIHNDTGLECQKTGRVCPLKIEVLTQNPFAGNLFTFLLINLPDEMSLAQGASCQAIILTRNMSCRIMSNRQIRIGHSLAFTSKGYATLDYGFKINVTIENVQYPLTTEETGNFYMQTQERWNGTDYIIDQGSDFNFQVSKPGTITMIQANRTNFEPNQLTQFFVDFVVNSPLIKSTFVIIKVPRSQLSIDTKVAPWCFKRESQTNSKRINCKMISEDTFEVRDICQSNGCSNNTRFVIWIGNNSMIYNPDFEADVLTTDDSVKVIIKQNSTKEIGKSFEIQANLPNVYVQPRMVIIEDLRVSDAFIDETQAYQFQIITLKSKYLEKLFTKNFVRVKFYFTNFTQDPFYPIEAKINNVSSNITYVGKNSQGYIDYIVFQCLQVVCKGKKEADIEIKGFRNPGFKAINTTYKPRVQFGELSQVPDRLYTSNSTDLNNKLELLQTTQIVNFDTKLSNYASSSTNNTLELLFSLDKNPPVSPDSFVSVTLPSGYSAPTNLNCLQLFNNRNLTCKSSNNTIFLSNYFQLQSSPRILQQASSTFAKNTVVAIKLMNITNPTLSSVNSSLFITVANSQGLIYAESSAVTVSSFKVTQENCQDKENCAECSLINPRICTQCKNPSLAPVRQGYECQERCDSGYFEYNYQCYRCSEGCKECQTFDQCLKCNNTEKVLIDGKCLDKLNKFKFQLQCPDGSNSSSIYGCERNIYCTQSSCAKCGAEQSYCLECENGFSSLNGLCVNVCPNKYTLNSKKQCVKCDPTCQTCSKTAKTCSSCQLDVFSGFKLDYSVNKCLSQCSDGSYLRANDQTYCDPCHPSCQTCSGSKRECTSCYYHKETFEDLFLFQGKCQDSCPTGYYQNFQTHQCQETSFSIGQGGPIYLILSLLICGSIVLASNIKTKKKDKTSCIIMFFLTQIEFINRVILIAILWKTTQVLSFSLTGMNILANSLLGIYFAANVMHPLANQLKLPQFQGHSFNFLLTLSQFSGVNTLRLLSSRFFLLRSCCLPPQVVTLPHYLTHIETINTLSLFFTSCQFCVGLGTLTSNPFNSQAFGFGLSTVFLNALLFGFQYHKYRAYSKVSAQYSKVDQQPQSVVNSNATVVGVMRTSQGEGESRVGSANAQNRRSNSQIGSKSVQSSK